MKLTPEASSRTQERCVYALERPLWCGRAVVHQNDDDADCEDGQQNGDHQQHRALPGSSDGCSDMALRSYVLYLNAP
jgi:hypothetical protein